MQPVPKTIFQTWKSRHDIPENFAYWRASFRRLNPNYDMVLWDDADNRELISTRFPSFLELYDKFPAEIFRADAIRYFFLYEFGGVYVDMDTECLRPIDQIINGSSGVTLGRMGEPEFVHSIPNAIMFSRKGEEFWLFVIGLMMSGAGRHERPEHATGPVLLRAAVERYMMPECRPQVEAVIGDVCQVFGMQRPREPTSINILPSAILYPVNWNDPVHQYFVRLPVINERRLLTPEEAARLFPKSTMVTYWAHSW